jgi:hypothetical protein
MLTLFITKPTKAPEKEKKFINVKSLTPIIKYASIPKALEDRVRGLKIKDYNVHIGLRIAHKLWECHCNNEERSDDGYFPLASGYKNDILNGYRKYYKYFTLFEEDGIFDSKPFSKVRNECKYIKLNPDLIKGEKVEVSYVQYYNIKPNLIGVARQVHSTLCKLELPFSNEKEIRILVESQKDKILERELSENPEFDVSELGDVMKSHVTILNSLLDMKSQSCWRNKTNNRLDHPLTRLPSIYLPLLKLEGEPLVEIDFKNCQPCLLIHYLNGLMQGKEIGIHQYSSYSIKDKESFHSLFSVLEKMVCQPGFSELAEHCYKGTLYDSFVQPGDPPSKREEIKHIMLPFLFGKYWQVQHSKRYEQINEKYPILMEIVGLIKRELGNALFARQTKALKDKRKLRIGKHEKTAKEAGSDEFANILARMESRLMIDQVLPKLIDAGLDVITRHDAILMKESDLDRVKAIMVKILDSELGEGKYSLKVEKIVTNSEKVL